MLRRAAALAAASLLALTGCASDPEPEPAWTEEEAYAEAERVYREYDAAISDFLAGNHDVDPLRFMTGDVRESSQATQEHIIDEGIVASGDAPIVDFVGQEFFVVGESAEVHATVCHDGSKVLITDRDGTETRPHADDGVYSLALEFVTRDGEWLMSASESGDMAVCD